MSNIDDKYCSLLSERIREERERLDFNQREIAEKCGISREMWGKYERAISFPGGEVLFLFAAIGADINYIMTGQRTVKVSEDNPGYALSEDEKALLYYLARCSEEDQAFIKRMARLAATTTPPPT